MELINQHTKKIMEGCKERARAAGLTFHDETLEYIVTNRDLIELSPKVMIPTLYDYWVHDVEVLREKGRYELYPSNPYETVINTRPAISFYNDNNPDWLNVMIFYHVLAHIDFFQNNLYFRHTWEYDFTAEALSDKRMMATLRSEKGRWVDYVIEFSRGIDNLVGYYEELSDIHRAVETDHNAQFHFYFDVFLQSIKEVKIPEYVKEVERYNECRRQAGEMGEQAFFAEIHTRYPEFEAVFQKNRKEKSRRPVDLFVYLAERSEFLNRDENRWMLPILTVIRKTSLFFQPQIRTKILNEGWASYWHEVLFLQDDRINGHEVEFARVNAGVTALPRVGLNPYALGMRLFYHLEEMADKGKISWNYQRLHDRKARDKYDSKAGGGRDFIFAVRENHSDFTFINTYINQEFVDRHRLFVAGKRLDPQRMVWQYFVRSRSADSYKNMILDGLFHPPNIALSVRDEDNVLCLNHVFEGKPLVQEYIPGTLMGIEYLWGHPVQLETSEVAEVPKSVREDVAKGVLPPEELAKAVRWRRYIYTMEDRKLTKKPVV